MFGGLLDVDLTDVVSVHPNDRPQHSLTPNGCPDRRSRASAQVVLEVTVGEADDERACRDNAPLESRALSCPTVSARQTLGTGFPRSGTRVTLRDEPLPTRLGVRGTPLAAREPLVMAVAIS